MSFKQYHRTAIAEMMDWTPDIDPLVMFMVSISAEDKKNGSPKAGDKIARNPKNHNDLWLVAAAYFAENFEPMSASKPSEPAQDATAMTPIDMVLHCPACGLQHIDEGEGEGDDGATVSRNDVWTNPPHRSHLCHGCGHVWRPADVPTNGVAAVKTHGKDDSPIEKDRLRAWPISTTPAAEVVLVDPNEPGLWPKQTVGLAAELLDHSLPVGTKLYPLAR